MLKYCFQNICRTCATVNDSLHEVSDSKQSSYLGVLQALGNNITDYGYQIPNKLCSPCLDKLHSCIDFRTQLQNADAYFQETLNKLREVEEKACSGDSDFDNKSGILTCVVYDSSDDASDEKPLQEMKNENFNLFVKLLYTCAKCKTSFHSSEHLTQHKARHDIDKGDLKCTYCMAEFGDPREIEAHIQAEHGNLKYYCGYCTTEFDYERLLQLHIGTHLSDTPQEIIQIRSNNNDNTLKGAGSSSDESLQTKRKKLKRKCVKNEQKIKIKPILDLSSPLSPGIDLTPYKGDDDDDTDEDLDNIVSDPEFSQNEDCQECRKRPAVNYMHMCRRCNTYFHSFEHLERHNEIHGAANSVEKRTCRYCNTVFIHMRHVAPHIRKQHSKDIKYRCGYCDRQFDTHRILQFHIGVHLNTLETQGENSMAIPDSTVMKYEFLNNVTTSTTGIICAMCGGASMFEDLESLQKHMTEQHNVTGNILPNGRIATNKFSESCEDRSYKCVKCGKGFPSSCAVKRHETTHDPDKPFYCNFGTCRWEFASEEELSLHAIVNHTGELGCPVCFKQFRDKRTMQKHMVSHRNKDRFKCNFCEKGFNYRLHLRNHESTHTSDTPHLCPQCGKGFRIKENYRQHILRHNKQRPHTCQLCPKSFLMPCHLKQHLKTHSVQCDVLCQTCGVQLRSQGELTKHLRVHRQNQLPELDSRYCCTLCMRYFKRKSAFDFHMKSHKSGVRVHQCDSCPWMFTSLALLREHIANRHSNKILKRRMGIFSNLPQCGAGTNTTQNISEEDNSTLCERDKNVTRVATSSSAVQNNQLNSNLEFRIPAVEAFHEK